MSKLENAYNVALPVLVEHLDRKKEAESFGKDIWVEIDFYKQDFVEIVQEVRKDVTELQLYKFIEVFDYYKQFL